MKLDVEVLEIDMSDSSSYEQRVKEHYEQRGYKVFHCTSEAYKIRELVPNLFFVSYGCPDLFLFKNIKDCFFLEVKTLEDGVRFSQMLWMMQQVKYKVKIVFVTGTRLPIFRDFTYRSTKSSTFKERIVYDKFIKFLREFLQISENDESKLKLSSD